MLKVGSNVEDRLKCNYPQSDEILPFFGVIALAKGVVVLFSEVFEKMK